MAVPSSSFELDHLPLISVAEILNILLSGGSLVVRCAEAVAVVFDFDIVKGHGDACASSKSFRADEAVALFLGVVVAQQSSSCILFADNRHLRCLKIVAVISVKAHRVDVEGQECVFTEVGGRHEVQAGYPIRAL